MSQGFWKDKWLNRGFIHTYRLPFSHLFSFPPFLTPFQSFLIFSPSMGLSFIYSDSFTSDFSFLIFFFTLALLHSQFNFFFHTTFFLQNNAHLLFSYFFGSSLILLIFQGLFHLFFPLSSHLVFYINTSLLPSSFFFTYIYLIILPLFFLRFCSSIHTSFLLACNSDHFTLHFTVAFIERGKKHAGRRKCTPLWIVCTYLKWIFPLSSWLSLHAPDVTLRNTFWALRLH